MGYIRESAEDFVKVFLEEGDKVTCDQTSKQYNGSAIVPPFYDRKKFKRGQQFFHKNLFSMMLGKLLGLIAGFGEDSLLNLLIHTGKSGNATTAYKRYGRTLFQMVQWYNYDFYPGSKSWRSLTEIRNIHKFASEQGVNANLGRITQKGMGLAQLGFIGHIVARGPLVGIHDASFEELQGFIHVWRVIGYFLGIEERFNICRDSVDETLEICNMLLARQVKPQVDKRNEDFFVMAKATINGMWYINPVLEENIALGYVYYTLLEPDLPADTKCQMVKEFVQLTPRDIQGIKQIAYLARFMKFSIVRISLNYYEYFTMWMLPRFPFLALLKMKKEDAYIWDAKKQEDSASGVSTIFGYFWKTMLLMATTWCLLTWIF